MTGEDTLARICSATIEEVGRRRGQTPIASLRQQVASLGDAPRGFGAALMDSVARTGFGLIAEIKKASPSGGMIRPEFEPAKLAADYVRGGAACLSVLTDAPYFSGALEHLAIARAAVSIPVLRKDFILDPWQVYESRLAGADCILLIMAALSNDMARELEAHARGLDMDVLVEVHDEAELERALGLQTKLIGINNRNLKTLKTDLDTTFRLAEMVPPDRFLVAESGIRTHEDVRRLAAVGAHAILVGESLLRQPDVTLAARKLLGTA